MKLVEKRDRRQPDAVPVLELPAPTKGNKVYYDSLLKGFGCRVTAAGSRAFVLNFVIDGRERRITIGAHPAWSVDAARRRAGELRQAIDRGEDPLQEREARRDAPTMANLCERYRETHMLKKRENSRAADERNIRNYILPALGNMKVEDVRFVDVDRLHRDISKAAKYQANRVQALLSKLFSLAIKWEMRADNPAKGVEKNAEEKRKRYLSGAELAALAEAMADHREKASANAVRLLMLTGARRNEVLTATWDQFDLLAGRWTKPGATTKQKTEHTVPLSAPARQLLDEMRAAVDQLPMEKRSRFIFPGVHGKPQADLKHFWQSVTKAASLILWSGQAGSEAGQLVLQLKGALGRLPTWAEWRAEAERQWSNRQDSTPPAGLTDVRIHDLRHTFASVLVSSGLSLPIVGALLGHTQVQTTARYAHLMDDPLRAATERAGALLVRRESSVVLPVRKYE